MRGGGGRGQRGDKSGKSRGYGLIYLDGTACRANPSGDGCISKAEVEIAPGRISRLVGGISRLPHEIQETGQCLREDEEMPGGARDRFERNEVGRRKLSREVKSTHHSNIVSCQSQVIGGS